MLFGARAENGCWGRQVSISRFWQNAEKQSFFSVNIPSKRQCIRPKLSKNYFFHTIPYYPGKTKTSKVSKYHTPHSFTPETCNEPVKFGMNRKAFVSTFKLAQV